MFGVNADLKNLLKEKNPLFWDLLYKKSVESSAFDEVFLLSSLRKKAKALELTPAKTTSHIRLAIIGGYSLYPLHDLVTHLFEVGGTEVDLFVGDYDNYISEIMDEGSELYKFKPDMVFMIPASRRCVYSGKLSDKVDIQRDEAQKTAQDILSLGKKVYDTCGAEIVLCNFTLPAHHDLGTYRARTMGSDWNFKKSVNLELGLKAPAFIHIADLEFLAARRGGLASHDARGWFETKQPGSPSLLLDIATELTHIVHSLKRASKKVLVLDLDNTLWGGVVADDGLEKIEVGGTSPRGESFLAFQKYILSLKDRGVLLAVCSKNDHERAAEAFEKHPEMALKMTDFVAFKANWNPKSDNIRQMALELNLGLDSFVFVDDNPAEIDIVKQFASDVAVIHLGEDPSTYVAQLKDSRYFEPRTITAEDLEKTEQYQSEAKRQALESSMTDMPTFLKSLEMVATISPFTSIDVPRLSQLINKSNQFNLTTKRRTEAEVLSLIDNKNYVTFSMRLADRFGDHGLISIFIGEYKKDILEIDTWLMSCRVLKRQVEDEYLNQVVKLAQEQNCKAVVGRYYPTSKNSMVKELLPQMGFGLSGEGEGYSEFKLDVSNFERHPTFIRTQWKK